MTQRCKITLDGVSLCPSENPRGFNVHVIKPYGEDVTHTYQRFDVLDDVAQFKALEDYIRNNASDFEVVILTAMESIQNNDADISAYSDIIDYLEDNLDAKREECSDFTFSGGRLSYALLSHKRPKNGLFSNYLSCGHLGNIEPYYTLHEDSFKPIETCGNPTDINNGSYAPTSQVQLWDEHAGTTTLIQQVKYSCNAGYRVEPRGASIVNCNHGTNRFEADPQCVVDTDCGNPPTIGNANFSPTYGYYEDGTTLTYTCNPGYTFIGKNTVDCVGKNWSEDYGSCYKDCNDTSPLSAEEITTLNLQVQSTTDSREVKLICMEGYSLLYNGDFRYQCQKDGTWNNTDHIPQCVNDCFTFKISTDTYTAAQAAEYCSGEDFGGTLAQQSLKLRWKVYHEKITTMMEARTVSNVHVGLSDVVQEDEFKFTQGDEVAQIKEYGETPTDNEELFATWNNNEPNNLNSNENHVVFHRDRGNYYLNDVSSSSLALALCEKASPLCHEGIKCPTIPNATVQLTRRYSGEDFVRRVEATVECDSGYVLNSNENTITCTADGWSQDLECVVDCGDPPVDHTSIEVIASDLLYGDVRVNREVTVACDLHNVEKENDFDKFRYEELYLYPKNADTTLLCPADGNSEWNYDSDNFHCVVGCPEVQYSMCVGDVTFISSDVSDELGQQLVSGASLQVAACKNEYCSCPGEDTDGQNCIDNDVECDKNGELTLNITCDTEAVKQYVRTCGVGISDELATNRVLISQITESYYIYKGTYTDDAKTLPRDSYYGANARLFRTIGEGAWGHNKARTKEPWIQVDLLSTKTIHSIATQGMERWSSTLRWTKMYHVKYGDSEDDLSYVVDDNGPIRFLGNYDNVTPHLNKFPTPINARFFRVYPIRWFDYIALRVELFEC